MITGALFWKDEAWAACLKVLAERPRRRHLQQALLYRHETSSFEEVPLAA